MVNINEMKLKDVSEETLRNYLKELDKDQLFFEYIKKFDIFILGFENYLTSIISKRIFDSNSYKHKLNIEL